MKLAFYKANHTGSEFHHKLISWWTKGPYSHVEIVDDAGYMYSASPKDGKVRKKKHKYDENIWDYVDVKISHIALYEFFLKTDGEPYDWAGVLGFVLPFKDRENKWFCSEWCSNLLKISGDNRFYKVEPSRVSPNRLYQIVTNQVITKGH